MFRATVVFFVIACLVLSVHSNIITIQVGQGGLKFVPQNATAETGDTLVFNWVNGGAHTVVQSNSPAGNCVASTTAGAFKSDKKTSGTFNYTITQTSGKIWYICDVPDHCQAGMWGVITIGGSDTPSSPSSPTTSSGTTPGSPSSASSTSITIATLLVLVSSAIMASFLA